MVDGDYKPGRYTTTYRDVALSSSNIPIQLLRTYDSIDTVVWRPRRRLETGAGQLPVESNGPLGAGALATRTRAAASRSLPRATTPTSRTSSRVTWPDGQSSASASRLTGVDSSCRRSRPPGSLREPGTTSTLAPVGNGLLLERRRLPPRRLLHRRRHLRPDPVRADRPVRRPVPARPACRPARHHRPQRQHRQHRQRRCRRLVGPLDRLRARRPAPDHPHRRPRRRHRLLVLHRRRPRAASTTRTARPRQFTYDDEHQPADDRPAAVSWCGPCTTTATVGSPRSPTATERHDHPRRRRRRAPAGHHRPHGTADDGQHLRRPRQPRPPGPGGRRPDNHDERHLRHPRPPADDDRRARHHTSRGPTTTKATSSPRRTTTTRSPRSRTTASDRSLTETDPLNRDRRTSTTRTAIC